MACPKGWEALTPFSAPDRATTPLLRTSRAGVLEPCDWERALILFCERFKAIQAKHGPESVAFLEHRSDRDRGDGASRRLFGSSAWAWSTATATRGSAWRRRRVAYKESFGFDAPPYTYADFEESDVIVLVGANLCIAHPIMWQRVMRNRNKPEIIVVDPRRPRRRWPRRSTMRIRPKSRPRAALRPRATS